MFRYLPALILLWTVGFSAAPAQAQWYSNFWAGIKRDYHRNVAWPAPFVQPDRESVLEPFAIMTANGWRRENLLSAHHFTDDNTQLNQAGEARVRYILTQMPPNRRVIFVQRGHSPDVTEQRLAIVQRSGNRMVPRGTLVDVAESDVVDDGWPADDIDAVTRKFNSTRPDPRLRKASSNADSGAPGSGGNN